MPLTARVRLIQDVSTRYLTTNPFKTKIEVTKIQGPLPKDLIEQIDRLLDQPMQEVKEQWEKIKQANSTDSKEPTSLGSDLYCFHFTKRFKHPSIRGKLIYALTFWNPFELIDNIGQMHGFFLDPPFQIIVPKTKDQWVKDMIEEQITRGQPVTKKDVAFYKKTYKRFVDQRKWINVLWIPTWSVDGVLAIHSRISGIQSVTSTLVGTTKQLAEIIPQYHTLRDIAESQKTVEEGYQHEIHRTGDKLRTANQVISETRRETIEKDVPFIIATGFKSQPGIPMMPTPPPTKPISQKLGLEGITTDDVLNAVPIILGLFFLIGFATNPPTLTALGILGSFLFLTGLFIYLWRKKTSVHMPEKLTEKAEETKQVLEEKVRGP